MSAPQPPAPQPPVSPNALFGELAIALGLLKPEQLNAGLAQQAEQRAQGQQPKAIGEILISRHWMDLRGVQKVLLEQQRRRRATGVVVAINDGRKIDHYVLQAKLGEGGMGTVFQAWDSLSNRPIALKVLHPKVALEKSFVERFRREARSAGAMNHPNIVAAYGSGEHQGAPYLAMEFVDGENLKMRLRRLGRLPEFEALNIIKEAALGLAHAHAQGIIHRDVKPDNILLGKDSSVKIADLGLAKSVEDDQRLTVTGMALGTPHYISPEQARGERDVDRRPGKPPGPRRGSLRPHGHADLQNDGQAAG
jgi:serine/threonine protein kinase